VVKLAAGVWFGRGEGCTAVPNLQTFDFGSGKKSEQRKILMTCSDF